MNRNTRPGAGDGPEGNGSRRQYRHHGLGLTLGSVAVAAVLAFGLGGRDAAKIVADSWAAKINR